MTSRPAPTINPDASLTTLYQLLAALLPDLRFGRAADAETIAGEKTSATVQDQASAQDPRLHSDAHKEVGDKKEKGNDRFQCLVAGVAPPLETEIKWLHANMHAPDFFLYLVVVPLFEE